MNNPTTAITDALKPCPFCGAEAELYEGHRDHWKVRCGGCEVMRGRWHAREGALEKAIASWNTRTAMQSATPSTPESEELVERLNAKRPGYAGTLQADGTVAYEVTSIEVLVNPDGPKAVKAISSLQKEIDTKTAEISMLKAEIRRCPKCLDREEAGRREFEYFQATSCPCTAAERYVASCPKHGLTPRPSPKGEQA